MARSGFYSVVKYAPDLVRREPLNVGIVVAEDEYGVRVQFADLAETPEPEASRRFESLLNHIAETEALAGAELFLLRFAERRFSHFLVTEPAQVMVDDLDRAARALCERVVGSLDASRI